MAGFSLDDLDSVVGTVGKKNLEEVVKDEMSKPACEFDTDVYRKYAPPYLEKDLPVIPLREMDKRPVFDGWSSFGHTPVPASTKRYWLKPSKYKNNMGLVTGKVSGICIVDIDTDEPEILALFDRILPPSPWKRIGQKGFALAYKYSNLRSFRIQCNAIGSIMDFLSDDKDGAGCQIVLPPSIHPKTLKPYVANANLIDVLDQLTELPYNVEDQLRKGLEDLGYDLSMKGYGKITDVLPAGVRDSKLTERAGLLAFAVRRSEITVKEAIGILHSVNETFVQQVEGDLMDMDKHISNFIGFLLNDVEVNKRPLPLGWDRGLDDVAKEKLGLTLRKDQVEKTYEAIMGEFSASLEAGKPMVDSIRAALEAIALKSTVDELQEKSYLRDMASGSEKQFTLADLSSYVKERRVNDRKETRGENGEKTLLEDHTSVATAALARMVKLFPKNTDPIRSDETGRVYKWMGSYWEEFKRSEIEEYISRNFQGLDITRKRGDITGITAQFIIFCPKRLKRDIRVGVNFNNGFLTSGGVLLPHHPDFGCTYVLPYSYRPDLADKMPMFKNYLYSCWGHEGAEEFKIKVKALQQAICCSLMGFATRFQKAFLLYGRPSTGKSVLLKIIASLFCDDAKAAVSPNQWKDNFQLVGMHNKLINIIGEISEKYRIEGSVFKEIVDGSPISVRHLYGEPFIFHSYAAQWAASNFLPKTSDTSDGFNRRWLVFEFRRIVPQHEVIPDLENKIISQEREAIVAWAMDCLSELVDAKHLVEPTSHTKVMRDLRAHNNPLRLFLQESSDIEYNDACWIEERDLYQSFIMYASEFLGTRERMPILAFRERIDELGDSLDIPALRDQGKTPRILRVNSRYWGLHATTSVANPSESSPLLAKANI